MPEPIIQVEHLGKKYIIGHELQTPHRSLRDAITHTTKGFVNRLKNPSMATNREDFWALQDINFEVRPGERIGIIGRNGAGKSTLLKILSRITEPSIGRVQIKGRVASLLEVGTGFHPELTGRENVFLNGAILGMQQAEIKRKFDEIVAFAEVSKFIDTPVKRYSSGMYVRLAFAVAAHLEPEILVVDEVLAVGDAQFQKKCLGKMESVTEQEGRTIIFVSHQMAAIQNLCQRCIYLKHGQIVADGPTDDVVRRYISESQDLGIALTERTDRKGTGDIRFTSLQLQDEDGKEVPLVYCGQSLSFLVRFQNHTNQALKNFFISIAINDALGQRLVVLNSEVVNADLEHVPPDVDQIRIEVKRLPLMPGRYGLTLFSKINLEIADWIADAAFLDVESGDYYGTGKLPVGGKGKFVMDYSIEIA
ncbi:Teichoic-acid-transporting ATPase (plasmid) [Thalassoporum mexicanum PCC 7367]|uniref:ABC transporter ATP-binding protein n=1 Tax=Thalassoporum mexicanum TaxID=3457544 RepID=UPI00029FECAC|nr:ABC transporter ATP-binding protein [Pseudanabaena sp. PCC 7367]AFY72029.1 Teichoic-acid-transporting ATPase [Pseudanabaena sp. PCC 7367]